jgi:hypothetical protein
MTPLESCQKNILDLLSIVVVYCVYVCFLLFTVPSVPFVLYLEHRVVVGCFVEFVLFQ